LIDGVVDIAIVGDNLLVEKERKFRNPKLGFQMVSVAVPKKHLNISVTATDIIRKPPVPPNATKAFQFFWRYCRYSEISGSECTADLTCGCYTQPKVQPLPFTQKQLENI
jgi:ATP phosphoribosyltransferase